MVGPGRRIISLRRRIVFAVVAVALGLLVVALGFEVVAKALAPRALEVKLGTDFEGLWRHDLPTISPETDVLLACAGDSHTEGAGAPLGFDYPEQLSLQLNAKDPQRRYQVLNLGVSGYNTSQAADRAINLLETVPRLPNVLLFCAGFNNMWNLEGASILPQEIREKSQKKSWEYLLAHSRAFKLTQITAARLAAFGDFAESGQPVNPFSGASADEADFLREWITFDLNRLWAATREKNVRLVLLTYTTTDAVFQSWGERAFREFAAAQGLLLIDVNSFGLPRAARFTAPSRWLAPDGHPNCFGYARIAHLISEELLQRPQLLKRGE